MIGQAAASFFPCWGGHRRRSWHGSRRQGQRPRARRLSQMQLHLRWPVSAPTNRWCQLSSRLTCFHLYAQRVSQRSAAAWQALLTFCTRSFTSADSVRNRPRSCWAGETVGGTTPQSRPSWERTQCQPCASFCLDRFRNQPGLPSVAITCALWPMLSPRCCRPVLWSCWSLRPGPSCWTICHLASKACRTFNFTSTMVVSTPSSATQAEGAREGMEIQRQITGPGPMPHIRSIRGPEFRRSPQTRKNKEKKGVCICMHVCMCTYVCVYVCMYVCMYVRMYVYRACLNSRATVPAPAGRTWVRRRESPANKPAATSVCVGVWLCVCAHMCRHAHT